MGNPLPRIDEFVSKVIVIYGVVSIYTAGYSLPIAEVRPDDFRNLVPETIPLLRDTVNLMSSDLYNFASTLFD